MPWIDRLSSMLLKKPQTREGRNSEVFFPRFQFFQKLIHMRRNNSVISSKRRTTNLEIILSGKVKKEISSIWLLKAISLLRKEAKQCSDSNKETTLEKLLLSETQPDRPVLNVRLLPKLSVFKEIPLRGCSVLLSRSSRETKRSINNLFLIDKPLSVSLQVKKYWVSFYGYRKK